MSKSASATSATQTKVWGLADFQSHLGLHIWSARTNASKRRSNMVTAATQWHLVPRKKRVRYTTETEGSLNDDELYKLPPFCAIYKRKMRMEVLI